MKYPCSKGIWEDYYTNNKKRLYNNFVYGSVGGWKKTYVVYLRKNNIITIEKQVLI